MSTLTSSAVGGRKAPPRAPPRRRAAPRTDEQHTSLTQASEATSTGADPASIDSTATDATNTHESSHGGFRSAPSPPVVVERPITLASTTTASRTAERTDQTVSTDNDASTAAAVNPVAVKIVASAGHAKRARDATQHEVASGTKRARITKSARSSTINASRGNAESSATGSSDVSSTILPTVETAAQDNTEQSRTSTRQRVATRKAKDSGNAPPKPRKARKTPAQAEQSEIPVDPAIDADPLTQGNADEVANALISQPDGGDDQVTAQQTTTTKKPRRPHRKKPAATPADGDGGGDGDGVANASNPDDLPEEEHEIDPATLSMYDLSHDSKHGKTSEREKKMAKINWAEVTRKRREEADAIINGEVRLEADGQNAIQSTEGVDGTAQLTTEGEQRENEDDPDESAARPEHITRASGGGVRFRIVGGQLVEDEASLTIDRAARVVQAAADTASDPVEEENDLTTRFNRTTYINARKRDPTERVPLWRSKSDAWTDEDTDRFYDALRMFGTDFFIISKMFPPRTRKQIKLKFVREERLEPDRVNAALLGRHTRHIDLDHYAQAINRDVNDFHKYDGLEHAEQVIRDSMKDKEEAMRAAVKEDEENNRQREAQRQQREKQRIEAEKKRDERAKKKAMGRRGDVWGAGTLGGADNDHDEFENE